MLKIKALYRKGLSIKEISDITGFSVLAVLKKVSKQNIRNDKETFDW